jgi:hypothetical protein
LVFGFWFWICNSLDSFYWYYWINKVRHWCLCNGSSWSLQFIGVFAMVLLWSLQFILFKDSLKCR